MKLIAPFLLLCVAGAFIWIAVSPWIGKTDDPTARATAPAPAAMALPALPDAQPARDLTPFLDRPLFSAARRPPPPEAPGEPIEDPMADEILKGRFNEGCVIRIKMKNKNELGFYEINKNIDIEEK